MRRKSLLGILVVQWLGLCPFTEGGMGWILLGGVTKKIKKLKNDSDALKKLGYDVILLKLFTTFKQQMIEWIKYIYIYINEFTFSINTYPLAVAPWSNRNCHTHKGTGVSAFYSLVICL